MFDSEGKTHSIKPFYLVINHLFGHIEKIERSSDRYLVVNTNNKKIINAFDKIWRFIEQRITSNGIWKFVENEIIFNNVNNKIKEYNKLRFRFRIKNKLFSYPTKLNSIIDINLDNKI